MGGRKKTKQKGSSKGNKQVKEDPVKASKQEEQQILLADDDSSQDENEVEMDTQQSTPAEEESSPTSNPQQEEDNENADEEEKTKVDVDPIVKPSFKSDGKYHNKQRCLILCSRGVTSRFRHLLEDLRTLVPHHKKDSKLDASKNQAGGLGGAVNEIAEMRGCNSVLFLECRKRQDAYLWIGHTGVGANSSSAGPSAKFLIENIHTMDELRLTGNCMKGSRPILSFDDNFDGRHELRLLKCLFTDVFGVPRGHPKSKPFVDRVMGFYYADGKVS